MTADESLDRTEQLLARLESARTRLEATDDPDAELAKEIEAELQRARRSAEADAAGA